MPALLRCTACDHRHHPTAPPPQVSAVNPLLRWLTAARVLFYCHFPDLL